MKRDMDYQNIISLKTGGLRGPGAGWKRGLTLIELLVASLIMVVVTGAAFSLFRLAATTEKHQQEVLTQTQNLRAALYAVSRDIRMAGSGLPMIGAPALQIYVDAALYDADTQDAGGAGGDWFLYKGETEYGVRAIFGSNSYRYAPAEQSKSDSLTIFRAELESTAALGVLGADFTPGTSTTVKLKNKITEGTTFSNDDILAIADGSAAVIVQVQADAGAYDDTLRLGPRFKPGKGLPASVGLKSFPAGSQVYNLRDITFVTYYVDTDNHRLMANYHDIAVADKDADDLSKKHLVTVADNIEDFQVSYYFSVAASVELDQNPDINLKRLNDGDVVRAVEMAMVSRAKNRSASSAEASSVEVLSHLDDPVKDKIASHRAKEEKGYTRRVMSEIVQLRNF